MWSKQYVLNSLCTDFHVLFLCDCKSLLKLRLTRWNVMQFHVQMHTGSGRGYNLSIHEIRRKWLLWGSHWGLYVRFQTDLNTVPCWDHLLSRQMLAERVEGSPLLQSHLWWSRKWETADWWKWENRGFLRFCYFKYSNDESINVVVFRHMEELILIKLLCVVLIFMIYFCCMYWIHLRFSWNIFRH